MRWVLATLAGASLAFSMPAHAQANDDDFTPLNSRIKRDRQFPTDIVNRWRAETSEVTRKRSRAMMSQFSRCLYNRDREGSLELLGKTDFGFVNFEQINLENDRAFRIYGFQDCLSRVAETHGTGVQLRWSASGLRLWLVQEAYFARYRDEPGWVQPGNVIGPREYPLSEQDPRVQSAMDLADCAVANDPYSADFFYRTESGSEDERRALDALAVALGPCLPQGQQVELSPALLRLWVGEALWHAATHTRPALPAAGTQEAAE
jgi:hypothetical protein